MSSLRNTLTLRVAGLDAKVPRIVPGSDSITNTTLDLFLGPQTTAAQLSAEIVNYVSSSPLAPQGILKQNCMWSSIRVTNLGTTVAPSLLPTDVVSLKLGEQADKRVIANVTIKSCDVLQLAYCSIM